MLRRAFTLLEVLITTILLIVGVVAVVKALADGTSVDYTVEGRAVALQLAQEEMEQQKDAVAFFDIVAKSRGAVSGFTEYQRDLLISGSDPKQLTVNVYWTINGVEQKITLQTLLTNPTPGS